MMISTSMPKSSGLTEHLDHTADCVVPVLGIVQISTLTMIPSMSSGLDLDGSTPTRFTDWRLGGIAMPSGISIQCGCVRRGV